MSRDKLDMYVSLPHGATAPRCQARSKRSGQQCGKAARQGYSVCHIHGAGKRETHPDARPTGRPPVHGLYSKSGMHNVQSLGEQAHETEAARDATDRELAMLQGTLWFLLAQSDKFEGRVHDADREMQRLEGIMEDVQDTPTAAEARLMGQALSDAFRAVREIDSWTARLLDAEVKTITMHKTRAETAAKLAETRALSYFLQLAHLCRDAVREATDDEALVAAFVDQLRREILGPERLELEGDDKMEA